MEQEQTRVDRLLRKWRDHKLISLLIVTGIVVIALESFTDAVSSIISRFTRESPPVELVDLRIIDEPQAIEKFSREVLREAMSLHEGASSFPIVDLRLVNKSDNSVVLTRLLLRARVVSSTENMTVCSPLHPTWNYSVVLDPTMKAQVEIVNVSQVIPPHGADRFIITVGQSMDADSVYSIGLSLRYNKGSQVDLGSHQVHVNGPPCGLGDRISLRQARQRTNPGILGDLIDLSAKRLKEKQKESQVEGARK